MANIKISDLPIGIPNSTSIFPFVDSGTTYQGNVVTQIVAGTNVSISPSGGTGAVTINATGGGSGGGGVIEVTYSELVDKITGETLSAGTFYTITDFRTCYDQPDFDVDGNSITTGNYKQSDVEPIVVFATSANTISTTAYQSLYPNDRIQYDWTFSETEVTQGVAYGRITERIDEFNNRTDYDHRTILFKRYRLYTYRQDQPLNGRIELFEDGTVEGNNTSFELLEVGDVIYVPSVSPNYYEITSIDDDVTMTVSGDTIGTSGDGLQFYKAIEEITNDDEYGGYFSYKRTNVKTDDFIEYTTFGDAISENYAKNNYIGNFANNYTELSNGDFILANNVFIQGEYESNKFGDYCYNNTWGTDNGNNIWGDYCYNNVSTNDIDDNIIGHYFNNNLINTNLTDNHIGNDFNDNKLLGENNDDFGDNIIGNGFNSNIIYSRFYKNEILDNFNDNVIGDSNNLDNLEFYRNYIRNNFNENSIRNNFQNNQIGTNFQENEINGEFQGNTILNGFNNNEIGNYFALNNIGNGFNDNTVYDDFYYNTTDYYFYSNVISYEFYNNNIGTYFENNEPTNLNLFGWNDLLTVSTRTYDNFYQVVGGGGLGNKLLGKELVMRVISTSQYFKIKFTQWTQGNNGGGFQYERQEIDSNGNTIGDVVVFTKTNNGNEVDIIVEGVLEITRAGQNGIYNIVSEEGWNSSVSPEDTEWNSIYTQENNGERFVYNKIGNNFRNNIIGSYFGYDDDNEDVNRNGNKIGDDFRNNTIVSAMHGNIIGNNFKDNEIRRWFRNNTIKNDFTDNTTNGYENSNNDEEIGFEGNLIGNGFSENEISYGFKDNTIGNNFNSNITGRRFENNNIGNNFNNNKPFNSELFGWNNLSNLTDRSFGTFYYSLNQAVGQYVVGTEMIMRIISTGQYFKIIFTQWTQGNNGGGFSYNRQEIDSNGNNIGDTVYFTKKDNGDEVDVIVEGVLEITRDNNNVIYNVVVEEDANSDVSPEDTEWNSIFTETNEAFAFESNSIQNDFENNLFNNDFENNTVGENFNENEISAGVYDNQIGNGFTQNEISDEVYDNQIGNSFNNNNINLEVYENIMGNYFESNTINITFNDNNIGNDFRNNQIGSMLFGWDDLSNIEERNYEVWREALDNNVGNNIVDKELVMRIISTQQYFKIKFTQWTQNANGGGFQYERQEIDSSGQPITDTVIFTKENYGDEVDIIVEGVVEITRGNQNGIYNVVSEESYNQSVSPADTQWNSIYSQQNEGPNFTTNKIGNSFEDNQCLGIFAYNTIGDSFGNNIIQDGFGFGGSQSQGNRIGNYFNNNSIGEYFYNNIISDGFNNNQVFDYFQMNNIKTPELNSVDFTLFYGNITGFSYTANGSTATDNTYTNLTGSTDGSGINADFDVTVSSGLVTDVILNNIGKYYEVNDTFTILGSEIGGTDGDDDVVITISGTTGTPSVYEPYNCDIFKNSGDINRLSYYDENDILTIKDIDN